jgi:Tol biopolymer transport system component
MPSTDRNRPQACRPGVLLVTLAIATFVSSAYVSTSDGAAPKRAYIGDVTFVDGRGVRVNNKPLFAGGNPALAATSSVRALYERDLLTVGPRSLVNFNLRIGNKTREYCTARPFGRLNTMQVKPSQEVLLGFIAPGSATCGSSASKARKQFRAGSNVLITDHGTLFEIRVAKTGTVVKVSHGAVVVGTGPQQSDAVVLGSRQRTVVPAREAPHAPTKIGALTPTERKDFKRLAQVAPPSSDDTKPKTTIVGVTGAHQPTSSLRQATFAFEASKPSVGVIFSCALDGPDFRVCASPFTTPNLAPGAHKFQVRATDTAGNVGPPSEEYDWTIDGSRIVFTTTRDSNPEIYTMDPDGKNVTRLTNNALDNVDDERPAWSPSPDGSPDLSRIVFDSNRDRTGGLSDIFVMNADGTGVTQLTHGPEGFNINASWSPDGTRIVFESSRTGTSEIYTMNADGSNQVQLTRDGTTVPGTAAADADWSVKNKIAFASRIRGKLEIYVMNADGSSRVRLTDNTDNNADDWGPAWSPDGEKLLFYRERREDGHAQIWIMNADGSDQRPLTDSTAGDYNPTWAPDGFTIAFQRSMHGEIYVADLDHLNEAIRITGSTSDENGLAPNW